MCKIFQKKIVTKKNFVRYFFWKKLKENIDQNLYSKKLKKI